MSPDQRRAMIVQVALPLVAEYGAAVTTSQIARAAGIGEATLFRAFDDKEELLAACVKEAVRPDHLLRELASISLDDPLPARLIEAADALRAHGARMGAVVGSLHASGHLHREKKSAARRSERQGSIAAVRAGLTELFEPDRNSLRLPPERLAAVFHGMLFARMRPGPAEDNGDELNTADLVDLFLHGALAEPG
jgi:AcrR family transcriptional regulator